MRWFAGRKSAAALSERNSQIVYRAILALALGLASMILYSCSSVPGSSGNGTQVGTQSTIGIKISPASAQVAPGGTIQFSATVSGTSDVAVAWSAKGGTITPTGLFTASKSGGSAVVTATSTANSTVTASASVTLITQSALAIESASLPSTETGVPYSASLVAQGGSIPYSWSITSGSLPQGVSLGANGTISGTALQNGSFPFAVKVTDAASHTQSASLTLTVTSSNNLNYSGYDGPAQLPLVYLQTSMADTPAPGSTITVNAGGNLQSALDSAACGDTILLQAGAVFSGLFKLPAKTCDDQHWIIVRTSSPDSALPAEGTRINPCYAGVASLPERPAFTCPAVKNVMAQLLFTGPGISGPIEIEPGANHYRLVGLEITRALPKEKLWDLVSPDLSNVSDADFQASNLIFDRLWVHGTATDETKGGVHLTGVTSAAVIDSYFTDFHCISVWGSCTDSQAVNGGEGSMPGGPYKINNNFLEAAGQSIMFGGGPATSTPADIEIRFNHLFKPAFWQPGAPNFVGGYTGNAFVVKNNLEFKNAQRVLVEGNILEHSWAGFTQHGFSVVLTPANQGGHCPDCRVTDITFRYNEITSVGGGFDIGNVRGITGAWATSGERYSIHDVLMENVSKTQYLGYGMFAMMITSSDNELLGYVSMQHNTMFPDPAGHIISVLDSVSPMPGFVFANNLVVSPPEPVWSAGGGDANCAATDVPLQVVSTCFPGYAFAGNLIVGSVPRYPSSDWPTGQLFTSSTNNVGFVDYAGGNYALSSSSPYVNKATDGKQVGADINGLNSMIAAVE